MSTVIDIDRRARVDALVTQARALRYFDYQRLGKLAEEAFNLASETDAAGEQYTLGVAAALGLLAHRNCVQGEWGQTLSQATQALAILEPGEPNLTLGEVYEALGWTHYHMGDYVRALEYLMRALDIAERLDERGLQAFALDRIAAVHASAGHPEIGRTTHERSLAMHRELGDELGEALALNNIAYSYMDLDELEQARECARTAQRYCERSGNLYLHMGVYDTLAEINILDGELDAAEKYSRLGLAMARKAGSVPDEANAMLTLGRICRMRGRYDDAIAATRAALVVAEERGRLVEQYICHELLSEILEAKGDHAGALEHFKRFHELKEARSDGETQSRLANLQVANQISGAKKDAEIMRLRNLALEREVEERRIAQATLEARASLDPLTGLFNRAHLSALSEELRLSSSTDSPLALILLDIDYFKQVNDVHGHLAGDHVLVSVARILRENARDSDIPCRFGGDEFLLVLEGMDCAAATAAAERLRRAVSLADLRFGDQHMSITISAGVSAVEAGHPVDLKALMSRADLALYNAKHSGRNRIVTADILVATR
jgi:diguanylate cyclase (GGDEF)-like protein